MMHFRRTMPRSVIVTPLVVIVAVFVLGNRSRLVSYDQLPGPAADWCEWGDATHPLDIAALQAAQFGAAVRPASYAAAAPGLLPADTCSAAGCDSIAERKPLRFIGDPNAGWSAISVDTTHNEVLLNDEFHFGAYVYDRTVQTPPAAPRTQPKRVILGYNTHSQYNSNAYIDPKTGEIYMVNNDSVPGMNVFSRTAQGDVKPDRELLTPYGAFGLAVNEAKNELFVSVQHDAAVMTFDKHAKDREPAKRLLQGYKTHMADPHGIAYNPKTNEIVLANYGTTRMTLMSSLGPGGSTAPRHVNWPAGNTLPFSYRFEVVYGTGKFGPPSITTFAADAQGNTSPLRVIEGPKAQLNWPTGVSLDAERGEVYVANAAGDSINVFNTSAQGDVAPVRVLKGPRTMMRNPNGVFVDTVNDELWVANYGNHLATVYKRDAAGDTAPIRIIRSAPLNQPTTLISNPFMIAYDSKREEIIVPNCVGQPRISLFSTLADGNIEPNRIVEGQKTLLNRTVHAVAYDDLHDEIIVNQNIGQAILTFRGNAKGDEAPIRIIQGPRTHLRDPQATFVDPVHNEIYVMNMSIGNELMVFDRMANGDVAPKRMLKGPDTRLGASVGAVDPVNNLLITSGQGAGGLLIFDRLAEGNTKPLRIISGPKTGIRGAGRMVVYPPTRKIIITAQSGNGDDAINGAYVAVFSEDDNGDVAPQWTIAKGHLKMVRGLTYDAKNKNIIVADKYQNAVLTFSLPEMFDKSGVQTAQR
jgi:DNA-binding beta-propeller fold protein YncE